MKVGIIGLGLIGGSIFKDLSKSYEVVAVSQSQNGENIYKSYDVLKDCDIVFVCTAMNKILSVLDELETVLNSKTIVADVCSLKSFVSQKKRPYNFIPSHPMAGTENKGFESHDPSVLAYDVRYPYVVLAEDVQSVAFKVSVESAVEF